MAFSKQKFDIATQPTTGRITAADLQQAKETIKNVKFSYCMIKVIEEVMVNNKTELADLNITSKNIANHIKNVSLTVNLDLNEMESTGRLSPDLIAGIVDALKSTTKIQNDLLAFIRLDIINYAKPATSSKTKNSVALAQPSRPQARLLPPVPLFAVSAKPVIKKVAPLARQFTFSLAEPVINETDKRKALHDATFLQLQMAYKDLRNDLEALRKKYRQLESSCQADKSASHSIVCLYPDENNQINQLWEEFLFQEKAVVQSRDYTPDNGIALSGLVKSKSQLQQSIGTLFHIIENKLTTFSKAKKGLSHKAREFEKAQKNKIDEKIAQNNIARVRQTDADESRSQVNLLKMKGKTSLPGALEPSASKTPLLDEKPHKAIPLNQDVMTKQFSTIQIPQLNEVIKSFIQLKKARTNLTIHITEDAHYYNLLYNIYRSFHGLKVYQQLASVKSSLIKEASLQGLHALQQQFGIASNLPEILKFLDSLTIEIPAAWLSAEFEITASHRELFLEKNLSLNAIRQQRYAINEFPIHIANTKLYQSMVNLHNTPVNHRNPMDDIAALQSYIRVIQTIHASIPVNPILRYTMQQVLMTEHLEKIHAISMLMMFCSQVSRDLIFVDENLREFILKCTQQAHTLSDTKVCYQEHVMSCITLLNDCDNYLGVINAESFQYAKPLSTYLEQAIIRCVYLNNKTDYTHWFSIAAAKSYADLYHSYQCYRAIRTYHYIGKYKSFPTVKEVQQDFIALFMQFCKTGAQRKFVDTITKDYQGNFPSEYSHLPYIAQLGLHKKDVEKLLMHFKFFTADTMSYFANEQYNPQVSASPIHHSNLALHKMHRQPPSLDYLQLTRHLLSLMKDILHFIHTYPGADSNKPIEFLDFCLVETQALRMLVLICGELEQYIMVSDIQLHEFFREAKSALKKSFSETSYDSSVTKDLDFIYRLDQQLKSYAPHLIHIKTTLLSPHVSNSFFYNGPIPLRLEEENQHRYIFS